MTSWAARTTAIEASQGEQISENEEQEVGRDAGWLMLLAAADGLVRDMCCEIPALTPMEVSTLVNPWASLLARTRVASADSVAVSAYPYVGRYDVVVQRR